MEVEVYGGNYDIFFWNFLIFEIVLIMDIVQMKIFSYNGIYFSCHGQLALLFIRDIVPQQ